MRPVHTVLLIQVFQSSASGILGIALPIMMKERQISVVAVGLVFAAMPLIFQFGRMIFATLSDFWRARATFRHWKATTLYHQIKDPYYVKQSWAISR